MAKDIVGGLFGLSPNQIMEQQRVADTQEALNFGQLMPQGYGAIGAGFSKLGAGAIRAGSSMLGLEDETLMKARDIEQIIKDTKADMPAGANPDQVYESLYNRLSDKGYANESLFALDARQKYLDNRKTMELKEKELDVNLQIAKNKANEAAIGKATTIAKNNLADQERLRTKLQDNITNAEGPYFSAAKGWAASKENSVWGAWDVDEDTLAKGLLNLQTELLDLTTTNELGIRSPLLAPDEAFKLAKGMLSETDETGKNLKWYKGSWLPWGSGSVTLPVDAKAAVIEYVQKQGLPISPDNSAGTQGLEGEDKEAYEWAIKNPTDPLAKDILTRLTK